MKHSRSGTSEHTNKIFCFMKEIQMQLFYLSFFFLVQSSLFSAASKSIQIKCFSDDEEENDNSTVRFPLQ